ncbi:MAG: permease-like cell division protein FtsX [candidate division WOR-3 bacterium]|nr:permease-like cell division protein FtsX [candidate division WOR-3 bacterium]MCX7948333.1 permease-like cell division protein FtsX [candidate division WOR-3 bacterium]MDW8150839.1 permease-like cell division protein FtsX [candidate division WOR-3 bacterium]
MFLLFEAFRFLSLRKSLTFFVITSTFLLFSLLSVVILITYQTFLYLQEIRKDIKIQAFLKPNLSVSDSIRIISILRTISGIEEIEYKSSGDAYAELLNTYREYSDVFSDIDKNELPSSFIIVPKIYWTKGILLEELSNKIKLIDGIDDIYYGKNWIFSLEKLSHIFMLISGFLIILIFLIFVFISSHAIKLAINDHRLAIEILKLSGVDYFRIYAPFRIMGILYGLISSILTYVFLNIVVFMLKYTGFQLFNITSLFPIGIIIFGILLGIISSENALREKP